MLTSGFTTYPHVYPNTETLYLTYNPANTFIDIHTKGMKVCVPTKILHHYLQQLWDFNTNPSKMNRETNCVIIYIMEYHSGIVRNV